MLTFILLYLILVTPFFPSHFSLIVFHCISILIFFLSLTKCNLWDKCWLYNQIFIKRKNRELFWCEFLGRELGFLHQILTWWWLKCHTTMAFGGSPTSSLVFLSFYLHFLYINSLFFFLRVSFPKSHFCRS